MRITKDFLLGLMIGPAILLAFSWATASPVTTPHQFTSGSPASAAEVNANFEAHAAAINHNWRRIERMLPRPRRVQASLTTDTAYTSGALVCDRTDWGGSLYDNATGRFTAPSTGLWLIVFNGSCKSNDQEGKVFINHWSQASGANEVPVKCAVRPGGDWQSLSLVAALWLQKGDTVRISAHDTEFRGDTGSGYTTFSAHEVYSALP